MRIGVTGGMLAEGFGEALRVLLPGAAIDIVPASSDAGDATLGTRFLPANHVLTIGLDIAQAGRHWHALPAFRFGGFHPDTCVIATGSGFLEGPTGTLHSRIALAAFLAGLAVPETVALYHRLAFSRLGYGEVFARDQAALAREWAASRAPIEDCFDAWRAAGCFMHAPDRPKVRVMLDLARAACAAMGIDAVPREAVQADLPDPLEYGPRHPVFPAIAGALGIGLEGEFRAADGRILSPEAFVDASFGCFAAAPRSALLALPRLRQTLANLGLQPAPPRPLRKPGTTMALLSRHGTLLRAGRLRGQMRHVPIAGEGQGDAPLVLADCTTQAARQSDPALAGATLQLGEPAPLVRFLRDGLYLCADRHHDTPTFNRAAAAEWEHFLPITQAEAGVLGQVVSRDWFMPATGETITADLIRAVDRFHLRLDRWSVDLVADFPSLDEQGGDISLTARLDGRLTTLLAAAPRQTLAAATHTLPALGEVLVLAGEPSFLPPPVTASDADRGWVYRMALHPTVLNGRARETRVVLRRDGGQLVWAGQGAPIREGVSVRFHPHLAGSHGWMEAAIRLAVLASLAPAGATFLLPHDLDANSIDAFAALGFADLPFYTLSPEGCLAEELIWLEDDTAAFPPQALDGIRARLPPGAQTGRRLLWMDGLAPPLADILSGNGFQAVRPGELSAGGQIRLLSQASHVIGRSRSVPLACCRPGTRIIELADANGFAGADWMIAVKLRLMHGILPCEAGKGVLLVEGDRVNTLLRVMEART